MRESTPTDGAEIIRRHFGLRGAVEVHERGGYVRLRVEPDGNLPRGGGRRGEVVSMSRQARRRALEDFVCHLGAAEEALQAGRRVQFPTYTYGRDAPEDGRRVKADWGAFKDRLRRTEWASAAGSCFWQLQGPTEVVDRTTGEVRTRIGAHNHAFVLDGPPEDWHREAWLEVTGAGGSPAWARQRYGVDVRAVSYLSAQFEFGLYLARHQSSGDQDANLPGLGNRRTHVNRARWYALAEPVTERELGPLEAVQVYHRARVLDAVLVTDDELRVRNAARARPEPVIVRQAPAVYVGAAARVVLHGDRGALEALARSPGGHEFREGRRVKRRRTDARARGIVGAVERMESYRVGFGGEGGSSESERAEGAAFAEVRRIA